MAVVVVESPAKAKTINKYLGKEHTVLASYGHVRDLPSKDGSVDPEQGLRHDLGGRLQGRSTCPRHRRGAQGGRRLILATDPDREGEAISWHLLEALKKRRALKKSQACQPRGVQRHHQGFVDQAMREPRDIDMELVEAYLARRALDYLVGFNLSPVLWRKLPGAKSAGRVQSVALRLIVEREMEIEAFRPREYWTVKAVLPRRGRDLRGPPRRGSGGRSSTSSTSPTRTTATGAVARSRPRASRRHGRGQAHDAQPRTAVHDLDAPAGGERRKLGSARTGPCAPPSGSTRPGHITYMRTDGVDMAPEAVRGARGRDRAPLRRDYLPRSRGSTRPRPRTRRRRTSASGRPAWPRRRRDLARPRGGEALRDDLEAFGRLQMEARAFAHHRRDRRRARGVWAARHGQVVSSTAFCGSTRKAATRPRSPTRRTTAACPRPSEGAARPPRGRAGAAFHPAARRATPRRRWSSGWRNSASAGPRPMPRSSPRCRIGNMCARTRTG